MSLLATRVQNLRVASPDFDKNMTRQSEYGALDFFVTQSDSGRSFITPELRNAAINSMGKTLQMPVIDYDGAVTVRNVRVCAIPDAENTSRLVTVSFATYGVGFTMVPARFLNNDISYNHDFERKMEKSIRALATALDLGAVASLTANKTQVFKDILEYSATANTIEVEWDNRMEITGDINSIMRANDYPCQIHIIGNAGIDSITRKMAQLSENNVINKVLEYSEKIFHYTNNIVNDTGFYGTAFAVEDGQVGYLTRNGRENVLGTRSNDHEWDIVRLPIINLPVDTNYYTAVGDQSTIGGAATEDIADMKCNVKQYFGFEIDIAYLVSFNSAPTTIANPIIQYAIESPVDLRSAIPVRVLP